MFLTKLETDIERQQIVELYEQYGNAMLLVARKFFGQDYGLAEDAVQNAWTRVVENFPRFKLFRVRREVLTSLLWLGTKLFQ